MSDHKRASEDQELTRKAMEISIRLGLVAALAFGCFLIVKPFLMPVLWGVIIAVALHPLFDRLVTLLGGRRKLAAGLFVAVTFSAIVFPTYLLSDSLSHGVKWLTVELQKDTIHIPPPPANVADWPLIGEPANELWTLASDNLEAAMRPFAPQLKAAGTKLVSTLTGLGMALLMTMLAVLLAGVMLVNSESGGRTTRSIGSRLGGKEGEATIELAIQTIRSVATGVIGVACVQSALAAIGLFAAGIPGVGLWSIMVLILAVAQLPPLLIMGPAVGYLVATSDSTITIVLFGVWALFVSVSDSFLKPMFLGRGMEIPMPVILIGAIGGMLLYGIIGLFVGAVTLAIGYKLFTAWMNAEGT